MKTNSILNIVIMGMCIINTSCFKNNYNNDSCTDDKNSTTVIGTGEIVEKNIDLESFSKINLVGNASITVKKGDTQSVTIKAQQNILDIMKYEVVNDQFNIGFDQGYKVKTSKGIYVDIITPGKLTDVTITGAGKINISNNKQDSFNVSIIGSGDVDAYNLEVENCTISIAGAGSCKVNVTKKLSITIAGAGNVSYKGHPKITKNIAGVGNIVDTN